MVLAFLLGSSPRTVMDDCSKSFLFFRLSASGANERGPSHAVARADWSPTVAFPLRPSQWSGTTFCGNGFAVTSHAQFGRCENAHACVQRSGRRSKIAHALIECYRWLYCRSKMFCEDDAASPSASPGGSNCASDVARVGTEMCLPYRVPIVGVNFLSSQPSIRARARGLRVRSERS